MKLWIKANGKCWHPFSQVLALTLFLGVVPVYPSQAPVREYYLDKQVFPDKVIEITTVHNLQSIHFPRDLEVEVKNVSGKPLYHVYFKLHFKNTLTTVSLEYGAPRLRELTTLSGSEDIAIESGATQVLRVPRGNGVGTENAIADGRLPLEATLNCRLIFQSASFGDGSGYRLKDYHPTKQ